LKINVKNAIRAQKALAKRVLMGDYLSYPLKYILGVDISYVKNIAVAVCSIYSFDRMRYLGSSYIIDHVKFPYIPGLLAFRELPSYLKLLSNLKGRSDIVILVDGHGIAHPRGLGIASHLGVTLDVPTIGVAKRILVGKVVTSNSRNLVVYKDRIVGEEVRVKPNVKPIYVSVGHKVSLELAVSIVKRTLRYRVPEPIRSAHIVSKAIAGELRHGP